MKIAFSIFHGFVYYFVDLFVRYLFHHVLGPMYFISSHRISIILLYILLQSARDVVTAGTARFNCHFDCNTCNIKLTKKVH